MITVLEKSLCNTRRMATNGEISYEEAVAKYVAGEILQKDGAVLCGLSTACFNKRLKTDHVSAIEASRRYRKKHKVVGVPKHERVDTDSYKKKMKKKMKAIHSDTLDKKIIEARKAGMSYGRYVAMVKAGVIA